MTKSRAFRLPLEHALGRALQRANSRSRELLYLVAHSRLRHDRRSGHVVAAGRRRLVAAGKQAEGRRQAGWRNESRAQPGSSTEHADPT